MKYFLFLVYLALGFVIWLFVGAQILLPIVYGLPRSVYDFIKGRVRFMAIISNIVSPIFWLILVAITWFILNRFKSLLSDSFVVGFFLGQCLATLSLLKAFLRKDDRTRMATDYENSTLKPFRKS